MAWPGLGFQSVVLYINCTYCSIAEEFKSDDEVKITTETKDADVTEEVYIFYTHRVRPAVWLIVWFD